MTAANDSEISAPCPSESAAAWRNCYRECRRLAAGFFSGGGAGAGIEPDDVAEVLSINTYSASADNMAGEMKTALVFLPLLAVWLTGCVGVVVPVPSHDKTYGKVITREQVRFIIPGQTARADVVEKLGSQFRDSPRLPALAYSWEQPAAGLLWFWVMVIPPSGLGDGDYNERSHWRAVFLAFDGSRKIRRAKIVSSHSHSKT